MDFVTAHYTDVGRVKETNQDSFALKVVGTPKGNAAFCVICDGMGGLAKGELASKEVTMAFCDWFNNEFSEMLRTDSFSEYELRKQWKEVVTYENSRIGEFARENEITMGTTATVILFYDNKYYATHVGDSRIYSIATEMKQLTTDHTLVASEVFAGRLTEEQAKVDPRRSVLLQCVGASPVVEPEFITGDILTTMSFMLCSDGFRHEITEEEIYSSLAPQYIANKESLALSCMQLSKLAMRRGENDNITVVVIEVIN